MFRNFDITSRSKWIWERVNWINCVTVADYKWCFDYCFSTCGFFPAPFHFCQRKNWPLLFNGIWMLVSMCMRWYDRLTITVGFTFRVRKKFIKFWFITLEMLSKRKLFLCPKWPITSFIYELSWFGFGMGRRVAQVPYTYTHTQSMIRLLVANHILSDPKQKGKNK